MDFAKAFTFFSEDPNWVTKYAIGALIVFASTLLFGLPMLLVVGYQIAQTRLVMEGERERLPEWDDPGKLLLDGLNLTVALLVYSAPALLLFCLSIAAFFIPVARSSGGDLDAVMGSIGMGLVVLLTCILVLYALALTFLAPAITIQYARQGTLSSLFRFGEVWELTRNNLGDIALVWLVLIVANIVLQLVILISAVTIIGPVIFSMVGPVWYLTGTGHLYGQIVAKDDSFFEPKPTY